MSRPQSRWQIKGPVHYDALIDGSSISGAVTLNFSGVNSYYRQFTLAGDVTLSFTDPSLSGIEIVLFVSQDATGGHSIDWSAINLDESAPVLDTTPSCTTCLVLKFDGTKYYVTGTDEISTATLADNSVTNAKLADMAAWTLKGRNAATTGDPQDVAVGDLTEETPASMHYLVGFDLSGQLRKYDVGNLPTGGGGESNDGGNLGAGVGVYSGKSGITLQFHSIVSPNSTIDVSLDGPNEEIDLDVADGAISNAKLADMPAWTVKMRNAATTGDPQDVISTDMTEDTAPHAKGNWLPAWTGTTLRKYDVTNIGPYINVLYYGATGDGSTDDTTAINNAIAAAAAGPHREIRFPAGNYRITSNLILVTNTHLVGEKGGGQSFGSRLQLEDAKIIMDGDDGAGTNFSFQNSIRNMRITFNDTSPPSEVIVHGAGYWNVLENVVMFDCGRDKLVSITGGNTFELRNVTLDGDDTNASQIGVEVTGGSVKMYGLSVQDTKLRGVDFRGGNVDIFGMYAENCLTNLHIQNGETLDKTAPSHLTVMGGLLRQRNAGLNIRFGASGAGNGCHNVTIDGVGFEWDDASGIDNACNWVYATVVCPNTIVRNTDPVYWRRHDTNAPVGNLENIQIEATKRVYDITTFGADSSGTLDSTAAIQAAVDGAVADGGEVYVPPGTFLCNGIDNSGANVRGAGMLMSKLKANSTTTVLNLGQTTESPSKGTWNFKSVSELTIDGNSQTSDGVSLTQAVDPRLSGRWSFRNVRFLECDKGLLKATGNIGNRFYDCQFYDCDYGYHATSQTSPLMHAGNDAFYGCHFQACDLAAIYIKSTVDGSGGTAFNDCIIEGNEGFGVFVLGMEDARVPLQFRNLWTEQNATAGSVTIDGTPYTPPSDVYFEDADNVVIDGWYVRDLELVNSKVSLLNCGFTTVSTLVKDAASTLIIEHAWIENFVSGTKYEWVMNTLKACTGVTASTVPTFLSPPYQGARYVGALNLIWSEAYEFDTGGLSGSPTNEDDGRVYNRCTEISVPASTTVTDVQFNTTDTKWYVTSIDMKLVSGTASDLVGDFLSTIRLAADFEDFIQTGEWVRISSVCQANAASKQSRLRLQNTGGVSPIVLRLSAAHVLEFDTQEEAIEFYNTHLYVESTDRNIAIITDTSATGSETIDMSALAAKRIEIVLTLTGDYTPTFNDPKYRSTLIFYITQDATGYRDITWPTILGPTPQIDFTPNSVTIVVLEFDGTNYHHFGTAGS